MNKIVSRASAACITHYHGSTRSIVSNNVVANCKYGIQIAADGAITSDDYTTVDNNIAVNNGLVIYEYPTAGPHNVYNNNIVYNNSTANLDLCCGGTQSGTITSTAAQFSALFVNYTGDMSGDYHLRSGAVAIDAGTTRCAAGMTGCVPVLDFDGVARPAGGAYDLGAGVDVERVVAAWYLGDSRIAYFDIGVSWNAVVWWMVFSGQSSGQTLQPEIYAFTRTSARYVRVVGHGNSQSAWNSITEVAILAPATTITSSNVPVAAVTVSPASTSVVVGATVQLAAVTRDSAGNTLTGRTVTWTSSTNGLATLSASGLLAGVATGTVTTTATNQGKSGKAAG